MDGRRRSLGLYADEAYLLQVKELNASLETEKASRTDLEMYVAVLNTQKNVLTEDADRLRLQLQEGTCSVPAAPGRYVPGASSSRKVRAQCLQLQEGTCPVPAAPGRYVPCACSSRKVCAQHLQLQEGTCPAPAAPGRYVRQQVPDGVSDFL